MWGCECGEAARAKVRPNPCLPDFQCSMACADRSTRVMPREAASAAQDHRVDALSASIER
jgi:hypothetical protein